VALHNIQVTIRSYAVDPAGLLQDTKNDPGNLGMVHNWLTLRVMHRMPPDWNRLLWALRAARRRRPYGLTFSQRGWFQALWCPGGAWDRQDNCGQLSCMLLKWLLS